MKSTSCPSSRRPRRYCRTAQVAPPWYGTPAIMPLKRIVRRRRVIALSRGHADVVKQACKNTIGIEILLGEGTGSSAMVLVVPRNIRGAGFGLFQGAKRQQTFADWEVATETRVLDQYRLARGEVTHGAIAEPAAVRIDVNALGDGELGTRALDVLPKRVGTSCSLHWINELPAMTLE